MFESTIRFGKIVLPIALGATGGYAYYYFIGCAAGSCPITSNPWISTTYGALIGFFMNPMTFIRKKEGGAK